MKAAEIKKKVIKHMAKEDKEFLGQIKDDKEMKKSLLKVKPKKKESKKEEKNEKKKRK